MDTWLQTHDNDLASAPRLSQRRGKAVEDLGSGFRREPSRSQPQASSSSRPKPRRKAKAPDSIRAESTDRDTALKRTTYAYRGTVLEVEPPDSESEDELDGLSNHNHSSPPRKSANMLGSLPVHPDYPPEKENVIKSLKFKKNKNTDANDGKKTDTLKDQELRPKSSVNDDDHSFGDPAPSRHKPGKKYTVNRPTTETASGSGFRSTRNRSPSPPARQTRHTCDEPKDPPVILPPRPRPRPVKPKQPQSTSSHDTSHPRSNNNRHQKAEKKRVPAPFPMGDTTPVAAPVKKRAPNPFPMSPLNGRDSPESASTSPPAPKAFPMLSPLGTPVARSKTKPQSKFKPPAVVPKDSAPAKNKTKSKSKGSSSAIKSKASNCIQTSGEEDDDEVITEPRPFPLSTQYMDGVGDSSLDATPRAGPSKKRSSGNGDGSDGDSGRKKKRREKERANDDEFNYDPVLAPLDYNVMGEGDEDEEDSLFISSSTDPKTLCPYCDTPLPAFPTPLLTRLLESTATKSYRDPRPTNPLGRKAPLTVFIGVCQRHRFESQILPEGEKKGWPKQIEWEKIRGRVEKMKNKLQALIDDPGPKIWESDDEDADADDEGRGRGKVKKVEKEGEKGPRAKCVFWMEVVKEVKKKGSRAVAGVRGQFANFEKTQPGYYGEQGSVIIHQTLYNLFPPSSMDPTLIAPLTSGEFIQRILVPEVGVRLIMEDMGLKGVEGMEKGIQVLRESANYGVAMFPEDGGEWGGEGASKDDDDMEMGVADLIIMERARKRRKELEEEEREEDELWDRQQAERERAEKASLDRDSKGNRRKGKKKEVETDVDMDADADTTDADALETTRSRPRPRPKPRPKTGTTNPYVPTDTETECSDAQASKHHSGEKENEAEETVALASRPRPRPLAKSKSFASSDFDDLPETGTCARSTRHSNTKPQPRSQSRNADVGLRDASNSAMDVSDAARTPKALPGYRTRSISKQRQLTTSSTFQRMRQDASEKSTSDSDVEVVAEHTIGGKRSESNPCIDDVDTTPHAGPSKGVGALSESTTFPLLMARRKKRNEEEGGSSKTASSKKDPWLRNMRATVDSSDGPGSEDQHDDPSDGFHVSAPRSKRQKDADKDAWLLSDASNGSSNDSV